MSRICTGIVKNFGFQPGQVWIGQDDHAIPSFTVISYNGIEVLFTDDQGQRGSLEEFGSSYRLEESYFIKSILDKYVS